MMLRRGDQGSEVAWIQDVLSGWGGTVIDPPGSFGVGTEAAIFVLQRCLGLVPDGIVGPKTLARLQQPDRPACFGDCPALTLVPDVPYLSQRDNQHHPATTCNVTSLAMALSYHGVQAAPGGQLEDQLYELLHSDEALAYYRHASPDLFQKGFPVHEVYTNLVWAAGRHGVRASFSTERSLADISAEIAAGRPVLLSGLFTRSGHIVLLIGITSAGDLICHDPYGDHRTGYRDRNGEARIYPAEIADTVLKEVGTARKWGLFLGK